MSIFKQVILIGLIAIAVLGGWETYERYARDRESAHTGAPGPGEGGADAGVPVELARVESGTSQSRVEAVGSTMSRRAVQIVPSASGRLDEIEFEPGQPVSAGDVLARLDDDIERANLAEAEASVAEAERALDRGRTLRQSNTVTQASLETLISQEAIARAGLERARRRLEDRSVRAPFDGVVGLSRVDPGARVDESTIITTLDDRSEVDIEFSLPETLYGRVSGGQEVTATAAAFPGRTFEGAVVSIDSRIDPVGRSFKVRARLPNPDQLLPAGMFVHLSVVMETRHALKVPEESVVAQGDSIHVWVAEDERATRRPVRIGQREAGTVEILEGLEVGERVVVRGLQRMREGVFVRVLGERGGEPEDIAGNGDGRV